MAYTITITCDIEDDDLDYVATEIGADGLKENSDKADYIAAHLEAMLGDEVKRLLFLKAEYDAEEEKSKALDAVEQKIDDGINAEAEAK